jgi:hypothetical protein
VRRLFGRHVDDDTLRALAIDPGSIAPRAARHVATCETCRHRAAAAGRGLHAHRAEAAASADALFTAGDLERQRRTILARIARAQRPARVLPFPRHDAALPPVRADRRWLAAAAAAGLILGAVVGQLPHWGAESSLADAPRPVATAPQMAAAPEARPLEDTLLSEVEAALDPDARRELRALDALTPVHYEMR